MNDDANDNQADLELETALKRYRPASPPPELRARVISTGSSKPARAPHYFGHSAVAYLSIAALIALAVVTHWATTLADARLSAELEMPPAMQQAAIEDLTEAFGGDLFARLNATLIVARMAVETHGTLNPEIPRMTIEGERR